MRGKVISYGDNFVEIKLKDGHDFRNCDEVTVRKLSVTPIEEIDALKAEVRDLRYGLDQAIRDIKKLYKESREEIESLKQATLIAESNLARRISSLEQSAPSYQPLWNERIETLDARLDHMDEAIKSLSVQRAQEISNDLKKDAARCHYNIHSCVTCKYNNDCYIQDDIYRDRRSRGLDEGGGCSEYEVFEEAYVADRDDIDRYEAE